MIFFWKKKKTDDNNENQINPEETHENAEEVDTSALGEIATDDELSQKLGSITEDAEQQDLVDEKYEVRQKTLSSEKQSPPLPDEEKSAEAHIDEEDEVKPTEKKGFFQRLKERLVKTKEGVFNKVKKLIRLKGTIDAELLEEIEEILIQSDVGVETTLKIIEAMKNSNQISSKNDSEFIISEFKKAILEILKKDERQINLSPAPPSVILVTGVNGTGKTTTIGKLAKHFRDDGKKVMLVAADTFRAAAIEQLEIWAKRTNSEFVAQKMGSDPASVCFDALSSAKNKDVDIILIDTAGRLHTKANLMEELKKVVRVIKKVLPDAPHETLLVLDATTGQNAISQAKIFIEAVAVSGLIMTKLDGTAKGGILIAIRDQFKIPILKIGIGEQVNDLRDFNPEEFVDALFEE